MLSNSSTGLRRRWVSVTAMVAGLLLLTDLTVRPASAQQSAPNRHQDRPAASPSLRDLDFLLGKYRCEFDGNPTVGDSTVFVKTVPILSGRYYELNIKQVKPDVPDLNGKWVIGWSDAESRFVSYYYDEKMMHGSAFAPARSGATLTFTGTYFLAGQGVIEVRDEFVVRDNNHYEIDEYVRRNGGDWIFFDHQDCRRQR
jgi:hypothetical protein